MIYDGHKRNHTHNINDIKTPKNWNYKFKFVKYIQKLRIYMF